MSHANYANRVQTGNGLSRGENGIPFFSAIQREEVSSLSSAGFARHSPPTLYVANQGVTIKLRFGGKAVPT
jgi:hypothetical protein